MLQLGWDRRKGPLSRKGVPKAGCPQEGPASVVLRFCFLPAGRGSSTRAEPGLVCLP